MLQKLLGVCFFSTILCLSYVATLHIVTTKVDALHHHSPATPPPVERLKTVNLSGPVSLRPISNHMPVSKKRYAVKKISKPAKYKKPLPKDMVKAKKKKPSRKVASIEKPSKKKLKKKSKRH